MFDEIIICVFHNVNKQAFFPVEERVRFLREATAHIGNVRVDSFSGLITDYMKAHEAHVIVRGVRSIKDLEYEQNEAYDPPSGARYRHGLPLDAAGVFIREFLGDPGAHPFPR
mgnify:CR=1 FL=1